MTFLKGHGSARGIKTASFIIGVEPIISVNNLHRSVRRRRCYWRVTAARFFLSSFCLFKKAMVLPLLT
jgi:hypothetical protein